MKSKLNNFLDYLAGAIVGVAFAAMMVFCVWFVRHYSHTALIFGIGFTLIWALVRMGSKWQEW